MIFASVLERLNLNRTELKNCEWRISIYGRSLTEWDKLAKWVVNNNVYSHNVRWLVQFPRLYDVYKQNGLVECFEDIVKSAFVVLALVVYE